MKFHSSVISISCCLLVAIGVALLVWAGGSMVYAQIYQHYENARFEDQSIANSQEPSELQEGDLIGKLEIPEVGISVIVLQGTKESTLSVAAGHIPGTALPGHNGNTAIAAHRDTFFRKLRGIHTGDSIQFSTSQGTSWYSVTTMEVVEPSNMKVLQSRGYSELTLITCYPFYFIGGAPQRFIVHALPSPGN